MTAARPSLATLGENGLLQLLTSRWKTDARHVVTGVGDDCAVLRGNGKNHFLLFKTDAVVEGVHFTPRERPERIGRKALARALSDLAAMGASPLAAIITLGVTRSESVARLSAIYRTFSQRGPARRMPRLPSGAPVRRAGRGSHFRHRPAGRHARKASSPFRAAPG